MKKNKTIFGVLVALVALSISACNLMPSARKSIDEPEESSNIDSSEDITDPQIYQIYKLYLASGGTLSYEEWLATVRGKDGEDGHSPVVTIGSNGNWFIDGNDTGVKAAGETGPQGQPGEQGDHGDKGDQGDKGDTGKSAYELYKETHPGYNKSEEEWLDDLLNGRLGEQVTHTVSFNTGGGSEIANQTIVHGEKVDKPSDPTRPGYVFKGWTYLDEPWSFAGYVVTEDMTLVAIWEAIDYVAVFKNEDGTVLETLDNLHYGDQLTYHGETPVKPNPEDHYVYTFDGWDKPLTVVDNMEFIAQFKADYAPYEEKYYNYDDTLLYSRYVSEDMQEAKYAKVTINGNAMSLSEGVRLEAENAELSSGIEKYYTDACSGGCFIGNFESNRTMTYTFECNANVEVETMFRIARSGETLPLSSYWTIKVNGVTVSLDGLTGPDTYGWENFIDLTGPRLSLKKGSNTIYIRANQPLNIDYLLLSRNVSDDITSLIETPTRPTANDRKYQFHGWDKVSDDNNLAIFKAHYEVATVGLEFVDNKVDVYHGTATDVIVPGWWDGFRISEIGHHSFQNTNTKSVSLPNTIAVIREGAFFDVTSLTTINFPNSLTKVEGYAFQGCTNLVNATLNEGLIELGNHSFDSVGLKEIIIPSTMKKIYDNAFASAFAEFVYIPATVELIQWMAFGTYINERKMTIFCEREYRPSCYEGQWADGNSVVWGYKGLVEENGYKYALTEIEGVKGATLLSIDSTVKNFELPEKVNGNTINGISNNAFAYNTKLETIVLPSFMTSIPARMFAHCEKVTSITLPNTITSIGEEAFCDCLRLTSFTMPDSVIEIGRAIFAGDVSLTSVTLSKNITVLTDQMFVNCDSLTFVDIPEGVTKITSRAFDNCERLTAVTMPSTIQTIENQAFTYSWNIAKIYCFCSQAQWTTLMETYTRDYDNLTLAVPYFYSEEMPTGAGDYWHYVNGVPTEW